MVNENKVVSAHADGFIVFYTDSQKHFEYRYERPPLKYLQKLKLYGDHYRGKQYQTFVTGNFSAYQNRLYKDAVYGLGSYSREQIKSMSLREKHQIRKTHQEAQKVINQWKQEIVIRMVDDLLQHGLPGCHKLMPKIRQILHVGEPFTSLKEMNPLSFAELNLSKQDIAGKLIEKGILPGNFFKAVA